MSYVDIPYVISRKILYTVYNIGSWSWHGRRIGAGVHPGSCSNGAFRNFGVSGGTLFFGGLV